MASKQAAQRMSEYAKWMKDHGIRRTTTVCPICYRTISVPTDRHFFGGNC